jgi:hypothetical protein
MGSRSGCHGVKIAAEVREGLSDWLTNNLRAVQRA